MTTKFGPRLRLDLRKQTETGEGGGLVLMTIRAALVGAGKSFLFENILNKRKRRGEWHVTLEKTNNKGSGL